MSNLLRTIERNMLRNHWGTWKPRMADGIFPKRIKGFRKGERAGAPKLGKPGMYPVIK